MSAAKERFQVLKSFGKIHFSASLNRALFIATDIFIIEIHFVHPEIEEDVFSPWLCLICTVKEHVTQPAFACSKSTIKTLGQGLKYVQS